MKQTIVGILLFIFGIVIGGVGIATAGIGIGIPMMPLGCYFVFRGIYQLCRTKKNSDAAERRKCFERTKVGGIFLGILLILIGVATSALFIGIPIIIFGVVLIVLTGFRTYSDLQKRPH
ncbi:MAG: hypothetical protein KAW02_05320 [candidate division Zixibacteria bacterium]|nr:hypothetical protein [candidate division Zixibacteria bacterium]